MTIVKESPVPPNATLMLGTDLAASTLLEAQRRADAFRERTGRAPCLATVLVGDDPASVTYVGMKQKRAARAHVESRDVHLPAHTTTDELVRALHDLSTDPTVDGILLQHPVPAHVDERAAFEAIAPAKDVDGVTMQSFASMSFGLPGLVSCTPGAILHLLDAHAIEIEGRHAVVVGRSPILGKPVGMLLLARNATVTYCHSRTVDLPEIISSGDIVVAAVGKPAFIRGSWIRPGAVVVDAGYNPGNIGDVAFDEVVERASFVTPVPGGVGPMTIALLIAQTVAAAYANADAGLSGS